MNVTTSPNPEALRQTLIDTMPRAKYVAHSIVAFLIAAAEAAVLICGSLIVAAAYVGFREDIPFDLYLALSVGAAIVYLILLELAGLYKLPALLSPLRHISWIVACWVSVFVMLVAILFLTKAGDVFSRVWLAGWFSTGLFFAIATRVSAGAALRYFNKQGQFNRNAVIVGSGETAAAAISALGGSQYSFVNLVGFFDDRSDDRSGLEVNGLRKLGNINALIDLARRARIDLIIVTLPHTAETRLLEILDRLWVLPVDVRVSAAGQKLTYRPRAYSYLGNLRCLDLMDKPLGDWGPVLKSIEDKVIASLALVALSPLLALVALAIKLDSRGSVFFKQKRYGFNNELIEVYKFRSMFAEKTDANATKLVTKNDARVTRVGRIIRRTSLDELPQLINVLKGELSLVGPRPHATKAKAGDELYEHVVDGYFARHKMKPGITGWAQINGWRGETDTHEKIRHRVEHDLHYIENWSLMFDLYILAKTPLSLLKSEGAY
jgi:Undecaprenyl-phosphate glucose phosphotransferase